MTEWREKSLGEVTSFIAKGIPPKYTEEENQDTVWVLNQKCNRNFEISYTESRLHDCTKKNVPADKMLRDGDVLINSTGTGTAGRVAQMLEVTVPTTVDGHMILLRPTAEIDPIYYGYAIKACQSQIEGLAEGSTGQTEINRRRLLDEVTIRYPSDISIQKNIGIFLTNIDRKIKVNMTINKNLEEQARTLYRQWRLCTIAPLQKLSEIAEINPETYSLKDSWKFVNYLDTSSITLGQISETQYIRPSKEKLPSRARRIIRENDIVYSTVRPNQLHYGIVTKPKPNKSSPY